jgi:hypothetical protein
MRFGYLITALLALALVGCDVDETERSAPEPTPAPSHEQPSSGSDDSMDPDRNDQTAPPAEQGTGLGTEHGSEGGEVIDPASGQGTGTTQ